MRRLFCCIVVLALPASLWAADPKPTDMVNNPPYENWSAFNPGTTVIQKETVKLADGSKLEITKTFRLLEKTKDKVVVQSTFSASDPGASEATATTTIFPAKVRMNAVDTPDGEDTSVTEGKEQVDLTGKTIEAEWVEATATSGDSVVVDKIWTAKDVPGGIVKQTITRKKGDKVVSDSVLEIVEIK
jgi:hypothetical protein